MKRLLCSIALGMAFVMQPAQADFIGDCNKILNGAQQSFKDIFPGDPVNQFFGNWCYRAYPVNQLARNQFANIILLGINNGDSSFLAGVYLMGGPFGDSPNYVGTLEEVFVLLGLPSGPEGGNTGDALCNASTPAISEIITRQEGDTIFVTTEGKCIKIPESENFCTPPTAKDENGVAIPTNISMLSETELISYEITGVDIPMIPGFPNPLDFITQGLTSSTCFEHVTEEFTRFKTDINICFDITDLAGSIPGASSKVTMAFQAQSTSTIVDNCANTNADSIINLLN